MSRPVTELETAGGSTTAPAGWSPGQLAIPDFVARRPTRPYHALNPSTKLVLAFAEAVVAFAVRGWTGPLVVLAVVLASAARARVFRRILPFVLATIPLVASILLVNTFLYPGAKDSIVEVGPLRPTWTGLVAATQATLRVVAFALSVALLGLTTPTDDLLADLERRGMGRRASFVVGSAILMVGRMRQRASEIVDSQRSRGMDTEGSVLRRARGVLPLAGPMVFGALSEVEEQTMALEARAFSAPARRTVIRTLPDSTAQLTARWVLLLATAGSIVASIAGWIRLP